MTGMSDQAFQVLVLVLQGVFALVMFLLGRWIASSKENTKEMKAALAAIVKENAEAMKELREALDLVRNTANQALSRDDFERFRNGQYRDHLHDLRDKLAERVPVTVFETLRAETRDTLHEFRNNFTDLAIVVGQLETQVLGRITRLFKKESTNG